MSMRSENQSVLNGPRPPSAGRGHEMAIRRLVPAQLTSPAGLMVVLDEPAPLTSGHGSSSASTHGASHRAGHGTSHGLGEW